MTKVKLAFVDETLFSNSGFYVHELNSTAESAVFLCCPRTQKITASSPCNLLLPTFC